MSLQTTTLLIILLAVAGGCASSNTSRSAGAASAPSSQTRAEPIPDGVDPLLASVGIVGRAVRLEGRLSSTGAQALNGSPFTALVDSTDHALVRMGGPFGITAARLLVTGETFVMVNYLLQEVWDGDPRSPQLKTAMHLPVPAGEMVSLMRGRPPGDASRFSRSAERDDNNVLFVAKDDRRVEYLLVDPSRNLILQYQTKNVEGETELDVAFQDVRTIGALAIPHKVLLATRDRTQTATIEITDVELDAEMDRPLSVSVPSSFERKTFR